MKKGNMDRRALLRGTALATVTTTLASMPALAAAGRDPLEDIAAQIPGGVQRQNEAYDALWEAEIAAEKAGFHVFTAPMTVACTGCVSASGVERAAAEAGFSPERVRELVGVWDSREEERQAQRVAAGLRPIEAAHEAATNEFDRLMQLLIDTPAATIAGLAVKLRQLVNVDIGPDEEMTIYALDVARSALRDAERLAGGGAA